jgi:hypothetical protein
VIGITLESIMKSKERWRQHLSDLMNAGLDPVIYAMQWARDPRCLQHGTNHRRVGAVTSLNAPVCPLWSVAAKRDWD